MWPDEKDRAPFESFVLSRDICYRFLRSKPPKNKKHPPYPMQNQTEPRELAPAPFALIGESYLKTKPPHPWFDAKKLAPTIFLCRPPFPHNSCKNRHVAAGIFEKATHVALKCALRQTTGHLGRILPNRGAEDGIPPLHFSSTRGAFASTVRV